MSAKFFSVVTALMVVAVAAQAQDFVTDGLVAMYTLDKADIDGDTVIDMSENGNDATIIGTLNFEAGVIGEAAIFDGSPNYIEVPDMGEMEQNSVECWAMEHDFSPNMQGILSTWQWEAGKVHFKFQDNAIQVDKNAVGKIQIPAVIDTWYHIIYTQGVDEGIKLYVDGELVAEMASAGALPEKWQERRLGSEHDGRFLKGKIDEVRIYDRVLDEDEVAQNFAVESNKLAVEPAGKLTTTWSRVKQDALIH